MINDSRRRLLQASLVGAGTLAMPKLFAKSARPKRILILGGTGFIGPHTIRTASLTPRAPCLPMKTNSDPTTMHGRFR